MVRLSPLQKQNNEDTIKKENKTAYNRRLAQWRVKWLSQVQ
jgi:hypothetical protein